MHAVAFTPMIAVLEHFIRRVIVEGSSMTPALQPGERVTAVRPYRRVRVGDVVVVRHKTAPSGLLVKRCVRRVGSKVVLRGDNAEASLDSRDFGPVAVRDVIYIVPVRLNKTSFPS